MVDLIYLKLRRYSYKKVVKVLGRLDFKAVRQKGSHLVLKGIRKERKRTVIVPKHDEIAVGTLKGIRNFVSGWAHRRGISQVN